VARNCPPSGGEGSFVVTLTNDGKDSASNIYIEVNGSPSGPYTVNPGENQSHTYVLGITADAHVKVTWVSDHGSVALLPDTVVTKCLPPPPPTPTPTPTPKPNHPPSGQLLPPLHIIVDDTQPVCVDKVSDPDGDQVSLNFVFKDTNGNVVGQKVGDVWIQPMGARCQNFKAPGTPQQVTVYVTLTDNATARGAASNASVTLSDNIPITPDQF
jgi:hypothetical protein